MSSAAAAAAVAGGAAGATAAAATTTTMALSMKVAVGVAISAAVVTGGGYGGSTLMSYMTVLQPTPSAPSPTIGTRTTENNRLNIPPNVDFGFDGKQQQQSSSSLAGVFPPGTARDAEDDEPDAGLGGQMQTLDSEGNGEEEALALDYGQDPQTGATPRQEDADEGTVDYGQEPPTPNNNDKADDAPATPPAPPKPVEVPAGETKPAQKP